MPSFAIAIEEEIQGYDASGLTAENMPQELAALAGLAAYLYDVFDWDRNSTVNFTVAGFGTGVSQRDLWELQYGGIAKGFLVRGAVRYIVRWTKGDVITDSNNSIIIYQEEVIL